MFQNCLKFHSPNGSWNYVEIPLVVFMPNITTNYAITYANCLPLCFRHRNRIGKHPSVERGRLDQVRSCITMLTRSRAFFIASILRTIRPGLFSKTGNTLESSVEVVKPPLEDMGDGKTKTATFAMSWFWFPEAQFGCAHGVVRTKVGYTGGSKPFPTYTSL